MNADITIDGVDEMSPAKLVMEGPYTEKKYAMSGEHRKKYTGCSLGTRELRAAKPFKIRGLEPRNPEY